MEGSGADGSRVGEPVRPIHAGTRMCALEISVTGPDSDELTAVERELLAKVVHDSLTSHFDVYPDSVVVQTMADH